MTETAAAAMGAYQSALDVIKRAGSHRENVVAAYAWALRCDRIRGSDMISEINRVIVARLGEAELDQVKAEAWRIVKQGRRRR